MITKNEISSLNLSPTKKDFVQIWNELIEVASKITERWDPTSTNESDPGIVLLKVLTGIADKLNYNIDKNILEAYMPTAAQMESMRKLCELAGYDIKYYQSAETRVRIAYTGNTSDLSDDNDEKLPSIGLTIPKFTTITNADKDITFITTNANDALITNSTPWVEVSCIEGQICQCESINESNLITLAQLDNNKYYLPEIQIAENGIFVYGTATSNTNLVSGTPWEQVSNLNTQPSGSKVFKFGYDSFEGRPYLAFPDDVGSLIGDGLFIYYTRTSGLNGNIKARALELLELPTGDGWDDYSAEQFEVVNFNATTNGANIESISTAYNNFKKTVGTFDTLVTCRDYMNKIYSLMDMDNSPHVSNILVTDIRNDINNSITLCSCNEFGILYKETPLTKIDTQTKIIKGDYHKHSIIEEPDNNGNMVNRLAIETANEAEVTTKIEVPKIDHFDLVLYPFKTFTQVSSSTKDLVSPYNDSFTYAETPFSEIKAAIADFKTCAHNLRLPDEGDIVSINNYLRLNAFVATSTKVSDIEATAILNNIKVALVNAFNLRNLDFGEEIPFDSILEVIENADARIKAVSLQEPKVLTTYSVKEYDEEKHGFTSKEYGIASSDEDEVSGVEYDYDNGHAKAKEIYNKLMLRNILAGRASLFEYDETFISNNSEKPYTVTECIYKDGNLLEDANTLKSLNDADKAALKSYLADEAAAKTELGEYILSNQGPSEGVLTLKVSKENKKNIYETYEPYKENSIIDNISRIEAECEIVSSATDEDGKGVFNNIKLAKNEVIKFRAPNLITTKTYPAYVYYHFERGTGSGSSGAASSSSAARGSAGSSSSGSDGRYADIMTLSSFINNVNQGKKPEKFFTGLWEAVSAGSLRTLNAKLYASSTDIDQQNILPSIFNSSIAIGTDITIEGQDKPSTIIFNTRTDLEQYINAIKALASDPDGENYSKNKEAAEKWLTGDKTDGTNCYLASFGDPTFVKACYDSLLEFAEAAWDAYEDYSELTPDETEELTPEEKEEYAEKTQISFKYYPLNDGTIPNWSAYIRDCYSELYGVELPSGTTLWRLSTTSSYPMGRLVAETGQQLFAQGGDYLTNSQVGNSTYICKDYGADPVSSSIPANSDVELKASSASRATSDSNSNTTTNSNDGDRLYIHYTPSSTNEDGESEDAEPISIVYESTKDAPIIVRPSGFSLVPSDDVHRQGTSWKKTGVKFTLSNGEVVTKDLLALAPNEQIELRDISRVILGSPARFYKNFDNAELEAGDVNKVINYELKDGEYVFYTDQNNTDAAYYGSGSVITLKKGARIPKATEQVEISQILEEGLHIVPWSDSVILNEKAGRTVTITEYQYVTLVEGDTLNTLTVAENPDRYITDADGKETPEYILSSLRKITTTDAKGEKSIVSAPWVSCISTEAKPIKYTRAEAQQTDTLPKIELESGPSTSWEVCSFLELSSAPATPQELRAAVGDNSAITNKLAVYQDTGTDEEPVVTFTPQKSVTIDETGNDAEGYEPMSIKLNLIAQTASGNFEKPKNTNKKSEDINVQLKVFKEQAPALVTLEDIDDTISPISILTTETLGLNTINNYWTGLEVVGKLVPKKAEDGSKLGQPAALMLNFLVPENSDTFGVFSIYLDVSSDKIDVSSSNSMLNAGSKVFIDVPADFGNYDDVINIFNYQAEADDGTCLHWWSDGIDTTFNNRLYLRAGLNCIQIKKTCSILIKAEDNATGNLIYDNMRLVKGVNTHGVNLNLLDPGATGVNKLKALKDTVLSEDATDEAKTAAEDTLVALADTVLSNIAGLDKNHDFYYNVPVENSLAIEFDNNISAFSNPYTLYDINNVNNSFVVSKLDIDYLVDENNNGGIKIAKSSRY